MKLGEKVVKYRTLILLISLFLLIPATIGYLSTGINYDMLSYLPKDMETMKGQDLLLKEFGKGGFSIKKMWQELYLNIRKLNMLIRFWI